MGTRPRAKSDMKVQQGHRRDAYFAALKRSAQSKSAAPSEPAAPAAKASTPAAS